LNLRRLSNRRGRTTRPPRALGLWWEKIGEKRGCCGPGRKGKAGRGKTLFMGGREEESTTIFVGRGGHSSYRNGIGENFGDRRSKEEKGTMKALPNFPVRRREGGEGQNWSGIHPFGKRRDVTSKLKTGGGWIISRCE